MFPTSRTAHISKKGLRGMPASRAGWARWYIRQYNRHKREQLATLAVWTLLLIESSGKG